MKYISIKDCLEKIDTTKINREKHANVYVGATNEQMILQFAYSEDKQDHLILVSENTPKNKKAQDEMWGEFLSVSMILEYAFEVARVVDDLRGEVHKEK